MVDLNRNFGLFQSVLLTDSPQLSLSIHAVSHGPFRLIVFRFQLLKSSCRRCAANAEPQELIVVSNEKLASDATPTVVVISSHASVEHIVNGLQGVCHVAKIMVKNQTWVNCYPTDKGAVDQTTVSHEWFSRIC